VSQMPPNPGWDQQPSWGPPGQAPPPEQPQWMPPPAGPGYPPQGYPPADPGYPPNQGWQQPGYGQPGYGEPPPGMPGYGAPAKKGPNPLLWVLLAVVVIAAAVGAYFVLAGDDEAGPEQVARDYFDAAVEGDCDRMMGLVDLDAAGVGLQEALELCNSGTAPGAGLGGDSPPELLSVEVSSETETEATVVVRTQRAGEDPIDDDVQLNKTDDGWKIDFGTPGEGPDTTTGTTSPPATSGPATTSPTTAPDSTSTTAPTDDSPGINGESQEELDALEASCAGGSMSDCDALYDATPVGSEQEAFAKTCGGLAPADDPQYGTCADNYG
jgi:hypothetical protein